MKRLTFTPLLLCVAAFAGAQAPDPFDAHCADIVILQSKAVQKELGITKAQRDRMNLHAKEHQKTLDALQKKYQGSKADPQGDLFKAFGILKSGVLQELTPTQVVRLRELSLQKIGLIALCDPIVAKKIGLSDAQVTKLRTTYDEGFRKFNEIDQGAAQKVLQPYGNVKPKDKAEADRINEEVKRKLLAARNGVAPQLKTIRDTYDRRMRAVLSPAQLNLYNSLRGKPFKS